MAISMLFLALLMAFTRGCTPSPGWTNSFMDTFLPSDAGGLPCVAHPLLLMCVAVPKRRTCMSKKRKIFELFVATVLLVLAVPSDAKKKDKTLGDKAEITASATPVLWREPADIGSRNLL